MKKLILSAAAFCLLGGLSAQTAEVESSRQKAIEIVVTSLDQPITYSTVNGVMVARLDEAASDSYASGLAEISFDEFVELLENSTEEVTYDTNDGGTVTVVNQPSLALLNDGVTITPPERLEDETVLAYINRLSELVYNQDEYHDYTVIGTAGGDLGLVYARITGVAGSANSIAESEDNFNLNVYPNPVSDIITISGLPVGNFMGKVLDPQGKEVLEITVSNNEQVDLSPLASGLYTISLLVEDQIVTQKVQLIK
ncbi:MAG: T9SS type A sorting domain-containing protein [Flavobacteriales bacterium]